MDGIDKIITGLKDLQSYLHTLESEIIVLQDKEKKNDDFFSMLETAIQMRNHK